MQILDEKKKTLDYVEKEYTGMLEKLEELCDLAWELNGKIAHISESGEEYDKLMEKYPMIRKLLTRICYVGW